MKIPKELKIGGHIYKVVCAPDWDGSDDETYGEQDPVTRTIYINNSYDKFHQEATLIHEIIHVLNSTMSHEFLDSFAEQLYQVLKDNKLLR